MTFRRSLYFSIAAHMLILSSALAAARCAGGMLPSPPHAILVSLVSSGTGPGAGTGALHRQEPGLRQPSPQPAEDMIEQQKAPGEIPAEPSAVSTMPSTGQAGDESDGGGNADVHAAASRAEGEGGKEKQGFMAPEQWAAIEAAIERAKNYPRLARERGIQGVVRLRFKLNPSGAVETIEIIESSGSQILDEASRLSVHRAAPMPYVSGWVEVPIAYVLE